MKRKAVALLVLALLVIVFDVTSYEYYDYDVMSISGYSPCREVEGWHSMDCVLGPDGTHIQNYYRRFSRFHPLAACPVQTYDVCHVLFGITTAFEQHDSY